MSPPPSVATRPLSWATFSTAALPALPAWANNSFAGSLWTEDMDQFVGYITCGISVLSLLVLGGVGLFYWRTRHRRPIPGALAQALLWVPISEGIAGVILVANLPGLDLYFRLVAGLPFLVTGAGCIMLSRLMVFRLPKQAAAQAAAFALVCAAAPFVITFFAAFFADP